MFLPKDQPHIPHNLELEAALLTRIWLEDDQTHCDTQCAIKLHHLVPQVEHLAKFAVSCPSSFEAKVLVTITVK
jgi:hypothetical protein